MTIATFIFFGSEIHSEIADTPTLYSKVIDLLSIFLILGAFVLPLDVSGRIRLNNLVIGSGAVALLLRLGVGVNRMFVSTGDGVLIGWIVLGFITLGFIFILIKIRNIWRTRK